MSTRLLKYYEHMERISGNDLFTGLVGYGLFPDKLPPIFTSLQWLDFYTKNAAAIQENQPSQYIFYESMRNTNIPRMMGIPNPIPYTILCDGLKNEWDNIKKIFKKETQNQEYKKSRIHIRKRKNTKSLFLMSYNDFSSDGEPEYDLLFDAHYMVKADISQCFPSMYSHSISWALVGKETAKSTINQRNLWYNRLDKYARNIKDGETNGFLIGPHASNLLSEIILCAVDSKLDKWHYFRNIDDYTCFVKDQKEAEAFLVDLNMTLKEFGLNLNHKKTEIVKLPVGQDESWVRRLKNVFALYSGSPVQYPQILAIMESAIDLVRETGNAAVFSYAMKTIATCPLNELARQYYIKIIFHLSLIYTYLFPLLDEYLFSPFDVSCCEIQKLSNLMYQNGLASKNPESISFALYFAIKYQFRINSFNSSQIIGLSDCILNTIAWQYAKVNDQTNDLQAFYAHAKKLMQINDNFKRNWIFVYEVAEKRDLNGKWLLMKQNGVSFLYLPEEIFAKSSPDYELMNMDLNLSCNCESFNKFFKELWEEYCKANTPENCSETHKEHFKTIILNLRIAFATRRNVRIPRDVKYYNKHFINKGKETCTIFNHIADWLKNSFYAGKRTGDVTYGYTSYWAKQELYSHFSEIPTEKLISTQRYRSSVVMKNKRKKVIDFPFNEKVSDYKKKLDSINSFFSEQTFSFFSPSGHQEVLHPLLTAIFNNSSWDLGGRLYSTANRGILYQDIPSDSRKTILINGEKTVEIDYSGLHVSMLYAERGQEPPADPYHFLPEDQRPLAKYAMLVAINASNEASVINALKKKRDELKGKNGLSPKKTLLKQALESCTDYTEIVSEMKRTHSAISDSFFSGAGLRLQNVDSRMALDIVYSFFTKGIPVLPVHDSFIIAERHAAALRSEMDSVFKSYNNGFSCKVK